MFPWLICNFVIFRSNSTFLVPILMNMCRNFTQFVEILHITSEPAAICWNVANVLKFDSPYIPPTFEGGPLHSNNYYFYFEPIYGSLKLRKRRVPVESTWAVNEKSRLFQQKVAQAQPPQQQKAKSSDVRREPFQNTDLSVEKSLQEKRNRHAQTAKKRKR